MKKLNLLLSFVFGIAIFSFFLFLYPYHMHYSEQFQMFLFSGDYLQNALASVGGFSGYIGTFFTQFFYHAWLGALIIALLLVALQRVLLAVGERIGGKPVYGAISFLPSLILLIMLCDENYLLAGIVATLLLAMFIWLYVKMPNSKMQIPFAIIALPLLYWIAGGAFMAFAVLVVLLELKRKGRNISFCFVASVVLISVVMPLLMKRIEPQFPQYRLLIGVNYNRYNVYLSSMFWMPLFATALAPLIASVMPNVIGKKEKLIWGAQAFLVVLLFAGCVTIFPDYGKEEVMSYDYLVRKQNWEAIVKQADAKAPTSPLSVSMLNLALAKQGLLGERMFDFYQKGIDGLMPKFVRDYMVPLMIGEIYYHLGFVNTSARYAFESMEAIPNFDKNVRVVKRLCETNIINGNYEVARKYLNLLRKTLFYRYWANRALEYLGDEEQINHHPEWGRLRELRVSEDFLFSDQEPDMMLGLLFQHNNSNRMAFEYLMANYLLNKDLPHFMQYLSLSGDSYHNVLPRSYQEAIVYVAGLSSNDLSHNLPYPVSKVVIDNVQRYGKIYTSQNNPEPMLRRQFAQTYWYYYHFRNIK